MKFSSTLIMAVAASLASAAPLKVNLEVSTKTISHPSLDQGSILQGVPKVNEPTLPNTKSLAKAVSVPKVGGAPNLPGVPKLPVDSPELPTGLGERDGVVPEVKAVPVPAVAVPAVVLPAVAVPAVPGLPKTPALPDVSKVVGLVKIPRGIAEPKVARDPAVDTATATDAVNKAANGAPSVESVPMVPVLPESEIKKLTKGAPLSNFAKFIERIRAKEKAAGAVEVVKGKATGAVEVVKGKVVAVIGSKLDPVTGLVKPLRETVDEVIKNVQGVTGPL